MIYRIADFNFEIDSYTPAFHEFCKDYLCNEATEPDCIIKTTFEDLRAEAKRNIDEGNPAPTVNMGDIGAVQRKISAYLLSHDSFLMHCAVIEYEGRGYAFTALSGTGKTTHINLWKKRFGEDRVTVINGDKPFLRYIDGKWYAYGTPWNGKERYGINGRVELCGIALINRSKTNSIDRLSAEEAIPYVLSQVMVADSENLTKQLELIDLMLEKIPFYKLNCNMDAEAAGVAYDGMREGK